MNRWTAFALIALLYALHQDFWFWREARPLVFGFMPIGLFYHAVFTIACALVMSLLVARAWPAHLESSTPDDRASRPRP
jgi:hypothetical protein